jgi:predicted glycogen debranching enzyme
MKYTDDQAFLEEIWDVLRSIIYEYKKGTDFGIHMDEDYLISHGEGLTWMDVKLGDYYPTPRAKKAVEIQALWYNALRIMSTFSNLLGVDDEYGDLAQHVSESFTNQYTQQYDVLDTKDASCRPNQIFLVSLDFSMINKSLQEKIVQTVEEKLLTPFGLRTLSPNDERYKGTYIGDYNKDLAYHNGTVWPWLLGPFITAFVKTHNHEAAWRAHAHTHFIQPMIDIYGDSWDGSIYEIFDGNPPFLPQGCITQAWSVAEILRAWVEDIERIKPEYEHALHEISV